MSRIKKFRKKIERELPFSPALSHLFNYPEFKHSKSEESPTKDALLQNLQNILDSPREEL
jgi:hypothetical protein